LQILLGKWILTQEWHKRKAESLDAQEWLRTHYEVEDICTLKCIFIGTHILARVAQGGDITNSNEVEAWRF
jgi:hypothetical protein